MHHPFRTLCVALVLLASLLSGASPLAAAATGDPWSANEQVNAVSGQVTAAPALDVDGEGNAYVVWQDFRNQDDYGADIYFRMRTVTGTWTSEVRVNTDVVSATQSAPDIAVDGAGNAYIVWIDRRDGSDGEVYLRIRHADGTWSAEEQVNTGSEALVAVPQESPAVAAAADGTLYVVWVDHRKAAPHIFFRERRSDGTWTGAEIDLTDDPIAVARCFPDIAATAGGDLQVVWYEPCSAPDLYGRGRFGGTWERSVQINDPRYGGPWYASPPSVGMDDAGHAIAIWTDKQDNYYAIRTDRRTASTTWGDDEFVSDLVLTEQAYPTVALSPSGWSWSAWHDMRNDAGNIYASWTLNGTWSTNRQVNDDATSRAQTTPAIAVDDAGTAYLVWVDGRNAESADDRQRDLYFATATITFDHRLYLPLVVRNRS